MVEKLLAQYGTPVVVDGRPARGLFQPVTGKLERLAVPVAGPLGYEDRERYIYIGPLEPEVRVDMELTVAEKCYMVRSAHQIYGDNGPVYCWALCVEKGREQTWDTSF